MYQNYVFDLYGTLADIRTNEWDMRLWEKLSDFYKMHGADYNPKELNWLYDVYVKEEQESVHRNHPFFENIDIKIDKVFRRMYEHKGVYPSHELVHETGLFFRRTSRLYIRLYPGIRELLDDLKKVGKIYLLTNAQRTFTWDELEVIGIRDDFDGIIISSDEECSKPDICFYNTLIDRFNIDPEKTIMVGNDPITDIKGGLRAGFDTLYIHSNISPAIKYDTGTTYFIPDGDTLKMRDYLL